jgi:hypothetical protein
MSEQSANLSLAVQLLEEADALIQKSLGATDVCYETHTRIQDIASDVQELIVMYEN